MSTTSTYARAAGVLFVCATVASVAGRALLAPVLEGGDLPGVAAQADRVATGAMLQLLSGFASAGIAVALYPVVRRRTPGLALGSVAFRLLEGTMYALGAVGSLMVLAMARRAADGAAALAVLDLRESASQVGVLAFYLGATLYYAAFWRSRLVPRWLSGWGLVGTGLGAAAALATVWGVLGVMSVPQVVLNLPIAVNEMVLAGWLLVVGLRDRHVPADLPVEVLEPAR